MDSWCQFLEDLEVRSGVEETMLIEPCLYKKNIKLYQVFIIRVMLVPVRISLRLVEKNVLFRSMEAS